MDHVWNSLKQWEEIWEEHLEDAKKKQDHEYTELLSGQLESIRKAIKEIGRWV
jgi:hypothetical protein